MSRRRRHVLRASLIAIAAALLGLGAFALLGGFDRIVTERVDGGGTRVVRVALVDAVVGFDVSPDELVVEPGTHVVLDVVNEGDEIHDLARQDGPRTKRLAPDQSQRLDLGIITRSLPELYCTLPGHKSAGMTLDIQTQHSADIGEGDGSSGIRTARPLVALLGTLDRKRHQAAWRVLRLGKPVRCVRAWLPVGGA